MNRNQNRVHEHTVLILEAKSESRLDGFRRVGWRTTHEPQEMNDLG